MNKEDLLKFCKPEHRAFDKPFSIGEYSYATDGSVLIRIKRLDDVPENPTAPKPDSLFNNPDQEYDIYPMPDGIEPKTVECSDCAGMGKNVKCPECGGRGDVWLSNSYSDYEVDCKFCGGSGTVKECESCNGTGKVAIEKKTKISYLTFNAKYLFMLKQIGVVSISIPKPSADMFQFKPAYFWWDGGDGLLMPMSN